MDNGQGYLRSFGQWTRDAPHSSIGQARSRTVRTMNKYRSRVSRKSLNNGQRNRLSKRRLSVVQIVKIVQSSSSAGSGRLRLGPSRPSRGGWDGFEPPTHQNAHGGWRLELSDAVCRSLKSDTKGALVRASQRTRGDLAVETGPVAGESGRPCGP